MLVARHDSRPLFGTHFDGSLPGYDKEGLWLAFLGIYFRDSAGLSCLAASRAALYMQTYIHMNYDGRDNHVRRIVGVSVTANARSPSVAVRSSTFVLSVN